MHTSIRIPPVAPAHPRKTLYFSIYFLATLPIDTTNSPTTLCICSVTSRTHARGFTTIHFFPIRWDRGGVQYKRGNPITYSGLCRTTNTLGIIQNKKKAPTKGPKFILEGYLILCSVFTRRSVVHIFPPFNQHCLANCYRRVLSYWREIPMAIAPDLIPLAGPIHEAFHKVN